MFFWLKNHLQSPTDLLLSGDSLETVLSPSPPPTPTPTAASVEIHRVPSRATVTPVASQPQNGLQPPSSTGESPLKKKASVLASLESLADLTGLARRKLRKRNTKLQRHSVMCTSSEFGSTSGTGKVSFTYCCFRTSLLARYGYFFQCAGEIYRKAVSLWRILLVLYRLTQGRYYTRHPALGFAFSCVWQKLLIESGVEADLSSKKPCRTGTLTNVTLISLR